MPRLSGLHSVRDSTAARPDFSLAAVVSHGAFAQHVLENCNKPPNTKNSSGFEDLIEGVSPEDLAGEYGTPLGFSSGAYAKSADDDINRLPSSGKLGAPTRIMTAASTMNSIRSDADIPSPEAAPSNAPPKKLGWVVREVSVQAGSVAILYDREMPSQPASPSTGSSAGPYGAFDTPLTHDVLMRPINTDSVDSGSLFYAWLYNQTEIVDSAMKYFAVPLNRYLTCRCDDAAPREVVVDFKKGKAEKCIQRVDTGELKVIADIEHMNSQWEIEGFKDVKDCFSITPQVVEGEELDEGDTITGMDLNFGATAVQAGSRWESNPAFIEQKLGRLEFPKVRLRVQKDKQKLRQKFEGLVSHSLRCAFVQGDALTFCSEVDCSFSGLALIGDMTGSVQLEAWGSADKRDLRSMNIAEGSSSMPKSRDRVIMLTFVPKGQPITGKRLRLRLLKGSIVLTKIGIFGVALERKSKTAADIMPNHEAYDFLFSDALSPKQKIKATLVAEQREKGVRRLLQFIPSRARTFARQYEEARSIAQIRVRCITCIRFGKAQDPRNLNSKSETRIFHTHSRYWVDSMDGYFDARRDPNEGFNPKYGEQPWVDAFQLHFRGVAVSPCGSQVAAITHQRFAVWSLDDGRLLDSQIVRALGNTQQHYQGAPPRVLKSLAWRQVGGDQRSCLILGCTTGDIMVFEGTWDLDCLELRCIIEGLHDTSIARITMTLDHNFVISASLPKGDTYNMQCLLWPFWEIGAREDRRELKRQGTYKQITMLSRELDICERTASQQRLVCQLQDTLREKVVRWAAIANLPSRETANKLSKYGVGDKEFQKKIEAARKSQVKVVNKLSKLAVLTESLKIDANVHMSEKHELVMDEEDDDVQRVLQILVLSHYQVAMLCQKATKDDPKQTGQEQYMCICVWNLGEARQIVPASEFRFPRQWVHPGTTACIVSSCPSIIACVPDKGLVLCELIRDFASRERKKADSVEPPFLTFADLQMKQFKYHPMSSMVLLANGVFDDVGEFEYLSKESVQKQRSAFEDTDLLTRGISPDLLMAVISPEVQPVPDFEQEEDRFDTRTFKQIQKINVDRLLKCFKVVEYRFSKPIEFLADGDNEDLQVQALNNMSDPPTFLLKRTSGKKPRVEIWPSPSAEVKGTMEPIWEDLLADHEPAEPDNATEDEAKTTASEGRHHVEDYEFNFAPKNNSKIDTYRGGKAARAAISFPYSRGTSRTTVGSAESVIVAMIPSDVAPKLHQNETIRLRAYYEPPVVDYNNRSMVVSRKMQQQDLPVMLHGVSDPVILHNILVEGVKSEGVGEIIKAPREWKLLDDRCYPQECESTADLYSDRFWHKRFRISVALHTPPKECIESHYLAFIDVLVCGKLEGNFGTSVVGSIMNSTQVYVKYRTAQMPGLYGLGHYGAVGYGPFKKKIVPEDSVLQEIDLVPGGICVLGKWKLENGEERTGLVFVDSDTRLESLTEARVVKVPESDGGWQLRCAEQHGDPFMLLWKPRCAQTALYYHPVPSADESSVDEARAEVVPFMNMEDKVKVLAVLETSHGVVYSTTGDLFFFKTDSINQWISHKSIKTVKNAKHVFGDRNKRRQDMYYTQVVTQVEFTSNDMVKERVIDTLQCRGAMSLVSVHRDVFAASFEQSFTVLFFQFAGGENNYVVLHQQVQMPYLMRAYEPIEQRVKGKRGRKMQRPTRSLKLCFSPGFDRKTSVGEDPSNRPMMPYLLGFSNPCGLSHERVQQRFCIVTSLSIFFVPLPRVKHDFLLETTKVPKPDSVVPMPTRAPRATAPTLEFHGADPNDSLLSLPPVLSSGVTTPICANIHRDENGDWYVDCALFHANLHVRLLFAQGDGQLGDAPDATNTAQIGMGEMGAGNPKPQAIAVFEPPSGSKDRPAVFVLTSSDIKSCAITEQAQQSNKAEDFLPIASWVDDINEHTSRWDGMLVSPDGRHIAAFATTKGGKDQEVALKLWDTVTRELNWDGRDRQMMPTVKCACFSEDSKFFVYCSSPSFRNRVYVIAADTAIPEVKWGSGVEYALNDGEEFCQCLSGTDAEASRGTDHVILMTTHQRLFYQSLNSPLHFTITPPWLTAPTPLLASTPDKSDVDADNEIEADYQKDTILKVYSQKKHKSGNKGMLEQFHRKGLRDCGLHCPLEIPDDAFVASSSKENYEPHFARITGHAGPQASQRRSMWNMQSEESNLGWIFGLGTSSEEEKTGRSGNWWKPDPHLVGQNIRGQWLQVDLGARFWVKGLRLQGKQQSYVKKFGLQLSTKALSEVSSYTECENFLLIEENSEDADMPLNYTEALEALFEKLDVTKAGSTDEVEADVEIDDDRDLHDAWFILPEAVEARFVCIEPQDQGGTHESVPGIRIEVYHQVPQLMAFNSADRHGQRYDLYYKTPESQTRTKLSKLSIAIANKMTLHDLFAAFDYKTKDRKAMRQGLQIDLAKFQLLRCALYRPDQNNCLTQVQSVSARLESARTVRGTDRMVLGLGYGQCYWSLLHELCNGDDQHDRLLSWLVEVGDESVPDEYSYLARMMVPAHLLVHSVVPWSWAKQRRNEMKQQSAMQYQYALFRPMDVMVHKVHNDWGHRVNLSDTLDRVVTQLVKVGEEGWWHLRGLIDELPIELVMGIEPDSFLLAVKAKGRQQDTAIKSVYSLAHLDVKNLGPLKEHSGMIELLVTIPNILGEPRAPRDSLLYRATHPDVRTQLANDEYYEKLEAFCGTQLIKIIIKYKWEQYVQYLFKLGFFVYILYLCLFTAVSMQFAHLDLKADPIMEVYGGQLLIGATFLYSLTEIFYLVVERKKSYFWGEEGLWNYCDWAIILLTVSTFWFMRSSHKNDNVEHRELALSLCSTCSIFVWLRSVYFAQGFKEWGQFVHVVFFIFRDSGYFLAMLLVILFGFAHGMYLFYRRDPAAEPPEGFDTVSMTLTTCYSMMMGDYPEELKNHWLTLLYFFVFVALISITLLNVLIAKMNDAYANTMARAQGKYSLSLATQIASLEASFAWLIRWKFRNCFGTWLCSRQRQEMHTDEETQQSIRIIDEHCEKLLSDLEQKFTQLTRSAQQVLENVTTQQMINQNSSRDLLDHFDRNAGGVLNQEQMRDVFDSAMSGPAADLIEIKYVLKNLQGLRTAQTEDKGEIKSNTQQSTQKPKLSRANLNPPRGTSIVTSRSPSLARMAPDSPKHIVPLSSIKITDLKITDLNKPRVRISALQGLSDGSCNSDSIETDGLDPNAGKKEDQLRFRSVESVIPVRDSQGMSELISPSSLFQDPVFEPPSEKPVARTSFGSLLEPECEFFEDRDSPPAVSASTAPSKSSITVTNVPLPKQHGGEASTESRAASADAQGSMNSNQTPKAKSPGKKKSVAKRQRLVSVGDSKSPRS